jgi:hypothetical protein
MSTTSAPGRIGRFGRGRPLCLTLLAAALVATDVRTSATAETPEPLLVDVVPREDIVISVRIIAGSSMSPAELAVLCREVDRIWRQEGVHLMWQDGGAIVEVARPAHLVLIIDATSNGPVQAWSASLATLAPVRNAYSQDPPAGRPDAVIKVSLPRARRLTEAAFAKERTAAVRDVWVQLRLPVLMGRAVAHEVGHYLLESRDHTAHGLMKASYGPADARYDREYGMDATQGARLRALWAKRGR